LVRYNVPDRAAGNGKKMGKAFDRALGAVYGWIPPPARPPLKSAFFKSEIRLRGWTSGRPVRHGKRVAFLDFEIAHLEDFEYLGPAKDEVEVEVCHSTISPGTESAVLCGLPGARRGFPYFPGYSFAGVVAAAGSRVRGIRVGDRVAGRAKHVSGDSVGAEWVFRIPEGVGLEAASFIELGIIVLQGVRKAAIQPGDRVAVVGQGLVGQLANRIASLAGAGRVTGIAAGNGRSGPALAAGGADDFVATRSGGFDAATIAADLVIEAVGNAEAIELAAACARRGGRIVLLGSSRGLSRNVDLARLLQSRGLELVGAHIGNVPARDASHGRHTYRQEGTLFLELLRGGRLSVDPLITWRPKPQECNAVYEALARGGKNHVGIVFDWHAAGAAA
jgi:threonine dehydrogenase-like Zn-dependent dehydrogenase